MSGSAQSPIVASGNLMLYGAIVISALNMVAFLTAFAVAYFAKDSSNLTLLIGAVIANASTAISFWLGSSAGSQRKTELDAQRPTPGASTP